MDKPLSKRAQSSKFIQITGVGGDLYAIDDNGRVWKYWPAETKTDGRLRYAFWGSVTTHRAPSA